MIHENVLKRLGIIKEEKKPVNILSENGKCIVYEKGCQAFVGEKGVLITAIIPEEDCFITSAGEKHCFTPASEIHFM